MGHRSLRPERAPRPRPRPPVCPAPPTQHRDLRSLGPPSKAVPSPALPAQVGWDQQPLGAPPSCRPSTGWGSLQRVGAEAQLSRGRGDTPLPQGDGPWVTALLPREASKEDLGGIVGPPAAPRAQRPSLGVAAVPWPTDPPAPHTALRSPRCGQVGGVSRPQTSFENDQPLLGSLGCWRLPAPCSFSRLPQNLGRPHRPPPPRRPLLGALRGTSCTILGCCPWKQGRSAGGGCLRGGPGPGPGVGLSPPASRDPAPDQRPLSASGQEPRLGAGPPQSSLGDGVLFLNPLPAPATSCSQRAEPHRPQLLTLLAPLSEQGRRLRRAPGLGPRAGWGTRAGPSPTPHRGSSWTAGPRS